MEIERSSFGARPSRTLLAIFAKYWQPREVKTRLGAAIGYEIAAELHRQFLLATICRLSNVAAARWLAGAPDSALPEFYQLCASSPHPWNVVPQCQGDLGRRMQHLFLAAFAAGIERVVVLGSDSPDVPIEYVEKALDRLADVPVVIGPSVDGGYYLLGASRTVPPIFENMPWSTATLFEKTTQRLVAAGVPFATLETWRDVDDVSDLDALRERLSATQGLDAALVELRNSISTCCVGNLRAVVTGA